MILHLYHLNPFACYLAETNLLIQVLDLLQAARDATFADSTAPGTREPEAALLL